MSGLPAAAAPCVTDVLKAVTKVLAGCCGAHALRMGVKESGTVRHPRPVFPASHCLGRHGIHLLHTDQEMHWDAEISQNGRVAAALAKAEENPLQLRSNVRPLKQASAQIPAYTPCRCGGTGRRARLKNPRPVMQPIVFWLHIGRFPCPGWSVTTEARRGLAREIRDRFATKTTAPRCPRFAPSGPRFTPSADAHPGRNKPHATLDAAKG